MKNALIFLAGLVTGGVGAYLVLNKTYEQRMADEIQETKEYYKEKYEPKEDIPEEKEEDEELDAKKLKAHASYEGFKVSEEDKVNYSKVASQYDTKSKSGNKKKVTKKEEVLAPYLINPDDYYNTNKDYEKLTLTYFSQDDIFLSETDVVVEGRSLVSDEIMEDQENFNKYDVGVMYVRNDEIKKDIEVVLNDEESAYDYIGGQE